MSVSSNAFSIPLPVIVWRVVRMMANIQGVKFGVIALNLTPCFLPPIAHLLLWYLRESAALKWTVVKSGSIGGWRCEEINIVSTRNKIDRYCDIGIEENDSIGTQRHIAINNLQCGLGWSTRVNGMNEGVLPDSIAIRAELGWVMGWGVLELAKTMNFGHFN